MRITLPIIAIILLICCSLPTLECGDEDGHTLQPPLPPQVLASIYRCSSRAAGAAETDDREPTTAPSEDDKAPPEPALQIDLADAPADPQVRR